MKISNILWLQLLQCEDLLLFFILYYCTLNIFGFWTVCLEKLNVWSHQHGFFKIFWSFYFVIHWYSQVSFCAISDCYHVFITVVINSNMVTFTNIWLTCWGNPVSGRTVNEAIVCWCSVALLSILYSYSVCITIQWHTSIHAFSAYTPWIHALELRHIATSTYLISIATRAITRTLEILRSWVPTNIKKHL